MNWRLNKIQYPVYNLGPGRRVGVWVQGCDLGCRGCVNQTLWDARGGRDVAVVDLFNWLLSLGDGYDGVTVSGGEPFQQYAPLIAFLHLVKTRTAHDTYCFTGYYLRELEEMFPDRLFARYLDYLVDGRYVAALHEDWNVKGSSNQTLYQFEGGEARAVEAVPTGRWSVRVTEDQHVYMAGVPRKGDLDAVCARLAEAGIEKEFK
jgi:anaerobic ribonucleoside-triphosphate reductase activating protein